MKTTRLLFRAVSEWGSLARDRARSLLVEILDMVCPPHCYACDKPLDHHDVLCSGCRSAIVWIGEHCALCGMAVLNPADDAGCVECRGRQLYFDRCRALALYEGALRRMVLLHKYRGSIQVRDWLVKALADFLRDEEDGSDLFDMPVLVPVPSHPLRTFLRGRDSLWELAEELSLAVDLELLPALQRRRFTRSQTRLTRGRRMCNPRGSFCIRRGFDVPERVLLLDDVATTCATVSEAARVLRLAGARSVEVLVLARSLSR